MIHIFLGSLLIRIQIIKKEKKENVKKSMMEITKLLMVKQDEE